MRQLPATDNASHQAFTREIDEFLMLCAKQVSNISSTKTHAAFHRLDVLLQQDLEFMGIEWNRLKVAKSKLPDVCEPEKLTSDEESEGGMWVFRGTMPDYNSQKMFPKYRITGKKHPAVLFDQGHRKRQKTEETTDVHMDNTAVVKTEEELQEMQRESEMAEEFGRMRDAEESQEPKFFCINCCTRIVAVFSPEPCHWCGMQWDRLFQ